MFASKTKTSAIAGAILLITSAAHAGSFGAIAYSIETGSYGYSTGYSYRQAAESAAHDYCYQNGASDCNTVIWFNNACGALSLSSNGVYGAAYNASINRAQNAAVDYCVANGGDGCYLEISNCSFE